MDTKKVELPKPPTFEGMSQYRPPLCFELVGKEFCLVMDDGYDYSLSFTDRKTLRFGRADGAPASYRYDCLKPEDTTYFVNLEMTGDAIKQVHTFILDLEQDLVTWVNARMGHNPRYPKQPQTTFVFGAIKGEDGSVPTIRHGYTNDMTGKAIRWRYGIQSVVHIYSSERYYRLTLPQEEIDKRPPPPPGAGPMRNIFAYDQVVYEEPCDYVKIKDGVYVFNMVETFLNRLLGQGNNLLFLMNLNRMYDVGRSFGYNSAKNPENYTYGAYGQYYDASEILAKPSTEYIR